jgi:class 3 adenylate cyclase
MPRDQELDKEIKFISVANTQIKFYHKTLQANIAQRIEKILHALEIKVESKFLANETRSPTRVDTFFDDEWHLSELAASASIRSYDANDLQHRCSHVLTLKSNEVRERINGVELLVRREAHAAIDEAARHRFITDGISFRDLEQFFPEVEFSLDDRVIRKVGECRIRRSVFNISVNSEPYSLSIDKYYFLNTVLNKYSETYTEIEIEKSVDSSGLDAKILQLSEILHSIFDVELEAVSKYQRFKDFSVSDGFEEFYFIGFDVASYSAESSWVQKQVVQRFHKIIKDEVTRAGFPKGNPPIKISIGDGAIVAARMDWPVIVRLLERIRAVVEKNNASNPSRWMEYRTAIHYGPVFRFTDLNDMMNLAGQGINVVSRVLAEIAAGQVVLSEPAYRRVIDAVPQQSNEFKDLGECQVKHGLELHLFEFMPTST